MIRGLLDRYGVRLLIDLPREKYSEVYMEVEKVVNSNFKNLRVVTGKERFHYVNVFGPREYFEGLASKYGVCLLAPKEDRETLDKINSTIKKTIKMAGQLGLDRSDENFRLPLRDGDVERTDMPEFSGCYFINATSKYMPEVVD